MFKKRKISGNNKRTDVDLVPEDKSESTVSATLSEDNPTKQTVAAKGAREVPAPEQIANGPTIRSTLAIDYQPDICKDYKQTGYCGYGDNCKFLHIRDYDSRPEPVKAKPDARPDVAPVEPQSDGLCGSCHKPPQTPVETACKHLFCEACFLAHHRKKPTCPTCGKPSSGAKPIAL